MHVAQINYFTDPQARPPEHILRDWPTLVDVAEAASCAGVRVSVLQASRHSQRLTRNGVNYHFLPFGRGASTDLRNDFLGELLHELDPAVLHVQGLGFARDVLSLAAFAPHLPIVLQDHANRPPRLWRRSLWRRGLSAASGIAFCSRRQAQPFQTARLLHPRTRVYEIPESTSRFVPGNREEARLAVGLTGDPLILWVGHLDANKDPLTALEGISKAVRALPQLRLCVCFATAPLLRAVQDRISVDPNLRGRVHLLGRVPHEQVEQLMRAADLFVLASHREGSGYSLIEALACGLCPVVTDIPSFRSLTGEGAVGALWPCDEPDKLCTALLSLAEQPRQETRAAVRAHFDAELSFAALGRKLHAMYQDCSRPA
ncbi:MAG TPA: glycosyltransferase family 4 protein [Steroidobacteraceae bacterium]|nr:glycosyltransferase family 4 protein [Steroidobacteraceae bacterium]